MSLDLMEIISLLLLAAGLLVAILERKRIITYWKESTKFRFVARTIGVAVAGYIVDAFKSGEALNLSSIAWGAGCAALSALFGLIGLEPFVGFNKTAVKVPVPPARPDRTP